MLPVRSFVPAALPSACPSCGAPDHVQWNSLRGRSALIPEAHTYVRCLEPLAVPQCQECGHEGWTPELTAAFAAAIQRSFAAEREAAEHAHTGADGNAPRPLHCACWDDPETGEHLTQFQAEIRDGMQSASDDQRIPATHYRLHCPCTYSLLDEYDAATAGGYGVGMANFEATSLRGQITRISYSRDMGAYLFEFTPGGFATVKREYISLFCDATGSLQHLVGTWQEIGYAEDGGIWYHDATTPRWYERLHVTMLAWRRRWRESTFLRARGTIRFRWWCPLCLLNHCAAVHQRGEWMPRWDRLDPTAPFGRGSGGHRRTRRRRNRPQAPQAST